MIERLQEIATNLTNELAEPLGLEAQTLVWRGSPEYVVAVKISATHPTMVNELGMPIWAKHEFSLTNQDKQRSMEWFAMIDPDTFFDTMHLELYEFFERIRAGYLIDI